MTPPEIQADLSMTQINKKRIDEFSTAVPTGDEYLLIQNSTTLKYSKVQVKDLASSHSHDDRYYTETEVDGLLSSKQNTLVSGSTIKTVNGSSLLGGGDIVVVGGGAVDSVNAKTGVVVIGKSDVGLSNVDNTSDANKPISNATQSALDAKATTSHTHTASNVTDFDAEVSNNTDVAANTDARHTHANKTLLDTYSQTEVNLADAVAKKHAHANSAVLDATTASFTTADETKLDGIAAGATANSSDATLLARANHTGTQSADTITDGTTNKTYTATEKTKLAGIATGAQVNTVTSVNTRTGAVTGLAEASDLTAHTGNTSNPHSVTKAQVGLGNVDNTADSAKPISTATQTALNAKTSQSYILSRGTDLVTNGTGYMGDNTNFAPATFVSSDAPLGAVGSFQYGIGGVWLTTELIPVDTNKRYQLSTSIRQAAVGVTAYNYNGLSPVDAFGNGIETQMYMCRPGTLTTLAAPLNPGDTTITLTSSANWKLTSGTATYWRKIIFWDYTDPGGKLWPPETYSRNTIDNAYPDGGISGNVITLNVPYAGAAKPAGTMLSNGGAGSTYMYGGMLNTIATNEWVKYTTSPLTPFGGVHVQPTTPGADPTSATRAFPPGTAQVRIVHLLNRTLSGNPQAGSVVRIAGISFSDASAAYATAELKAPLAHTHNDRYYTETEVDGLLSSKQNTLVSGSTIKTVNGSSLLGGGDIVVVGGGAVDSVNAKTGVVVIGKSDVGLSNVDNTSDANKPISNATQSALDAKATTSHTHTASNVTDFSAAVSANSDVSANTASRHSHTNKAILDAVTASYTAAEQSKLSGIAAGAEVNVNADWNASSGDAQIINKPTLGTSSALNVPATGNAAVGEVVKGNDTRLTDARTPTTHQHASSDITSGTLDIARIPTGSTGTTVSLGNHTHSGFESTVAAGTTAQYYRGDKSWQTLNKTAVGLANVDNTSDTNKPVSAATQTALNGKQATLVSGTNIKTINGSSILGSGDLTISSGGASSTYINTEHYAQANLSGSGYATLTGAVNGSNTAFTVPLNEYAIGTLKVFLNGVYQPIGDAITQTNPPTGMFSFISAPMTGSQIVVVYMRTATTSGSSAIYQTTIDFGSLDKTDDVFSVSDAMVSQGSRIIAYPTWNGSLGRDPDEIMADPITLSVEPLSGSMNIYASAIEGTVSGKYAINYVIG